MKINFLYEEKDSENTDSLSVTVPDDTVIGYNVLNGSFKIEWNITAILTLFSVEKISYYNNRFLVIINDRIDFEYLVEIAKEYNL